MVTSNATRLSAVLTIAVYVGTLVFGYLIVDGMLRVWSHFDRVLTATENSLSTSGPATVEIAAGLKATDTLLASVQVMLAITTVFTAAFPVLLVVFGAVFGREWISGRVSQAVEDGLRRTQESIFARLYHHLSWLDWRRLHNAEQQDLDVAIGYSEKALKLTQDPDIRIEIKSNLAYYYAEAGKQERKIVALRYAAEAKDYYMREGISESYVANDIFVRMKYANPCDQIVLRPLVSEIRDLIVSHSQLRVELERYLDEIRQKCPQAITD